MNRKLFSFLALVGLVLLGCGTSPGIRLVDDVSGRALGDLAIRVFIDDGIRCVTTPCPTQAREWTGSTDSAGRFELPPIGLEETATLYVDPYAPLVIDPGQRTIRLKARPLPVPPEQKLSLRVGFENDARAVTLRVENPGPEPLSIVNPDPASLSRYGTWGGWSILVKASRGPFVPVPFPGPYVAASRSDRLVLAAGESLSVEVAIGAWRRAGPPQAGHDVAFAEAGGRLTARARWGGMPDHLVGGGDSPPVIASAKTRRARDS